MNSKHMEYSWIKDILIELKSYPEHNKAVIQELIDHTNYKLKILEENLK